VGAKGENPRKGILVCNSLYASYARQSRILSPQGTRDTATKVR